MQYMTEAERGCDIAENASAKRMSWSHDSVLLCIDVGNSHLFGGVFDGDTLCLRFRHSSKVSTSDELGIFLRHVLRENECDPSNITMISICSVVPQIDYSLRAACLKYFSIDPFFLQPGAKTGLKIHYRNPVEVGADRIANAIGAISQFPEKNLIVIDYGTATTFCAIRADKTYLGGAILPGVRLSMEALSAKTAKLPSVDIIKMEQAVGRSTIESIQSGLYFGALGACRECIQRMKQEVFFKEDVMILATGGFSSLFEHESIYDKHLPDLVLHGLYIAATLNIS